MVLIFALVATYIGGPVGVILAISGLIGLFRNRANGQSGRSGVVLLIGIVLMILAVWMFIALANTNFAV